jgi:DNA replicative helicase MCM subunit Mcm2 (Cdc46/Mcm family)
MADGFANRFLWLSVEKSKPLPHGGGQVDYGELLKSLSTAIAFARSCTAHPLTRDEQANALWERVYPHLTSERVGMFGAVTSRAEAQALRLSVIYALLDCSSVVRVPHLAAALALWQYCQDSARSIFGAATGDDIADRILAALEAAGSEGVDLEAMTGLFSRHLKAARRDAALSRLCEAGLAHWRAIPTDGRSRTVYYGGPAPEEAAK